MRLIHHCFLSDHSTKKLERIHVEMQNNSHSVDVHELLKIEGNMNYE